MTGNKTLALNGVFFLLACCSMQAIGDEAATVFAQGSVVLPQLFDGLTWKYDENAVRKKLPHSTLEHIEATDGNMDSAYKGVVLPYFNQAMVEVYHEKNGKVISFIVSSDEPRKELCSPELEVRPKNCRNRYGPHLLEIRDKLLAHIRPMYGEGIVSKSCDWDSDVKRKVCVDNHSWMIDKDTHMLLEIYSGDDSWWTVSLRVAREAKNGP